MRKISRSTASWGGAAAGRGWRISLHCGEFPSQRRRLDGNRRKSHRWRWYADCSTPLRVHRARRKERWSMTRISRILVPTDFSAASDEALAFAKTLAGRFGASLHLVHAFEDPFTAAAFAAEAYSTVPLSLRDDMLREAEQRLADRLPDDQKVLFNGTTEIVTGTPTRTIVDYSATLGADLIVMGTHGRSGMAHLLLGSVAERVVRLAAAPVLTIRQPAGPVKRVLVPTDFSATADAALDYASLVAEGFGGSIQLLHVLDDPFVSEGLTAEAYISEAPVLRSAMLNDARSRLAHRSGP